MLGKKRPHLKICNSFGKPFGMTKTELDLNNKLC